MRELDCVGSHANAEADVERQQRVVVLREARLLPAEAEDDEAPQRSVAAAGSAGAATSPPSGG